MVNRNGISVLGPPPTAPIIEVGSWKKGCDFVGELKWLRCQKALRCYDILSLCQTLSPLSQNSQNKSLQRPMCFMVFCFFHGFFHWFLIVLQFCRKPAMPYAALEDGRHGRCRSGKRARLSTTRPELIPTDDALCGFCRCDPCAFFIFLSSFHSGFLLCVVAILFVIFEIC